jgi:hypothetical protein
VSERRLGESTLWAGLFGAVAAVAMLWIGAGHGLDGELAFAVNRLPRHFLLWIGGPDADQLPMLNGTVTGVFVFLVALIILFATARTTAGRTAVGTGSIPAVAFFILILWEVGYLLLSSAARSHLGRWALTIFLPWHLVALGLTAAFIGLSRRAALPQWARRVYWLLMFAMALAVLFPMTDSL